MTILADHDVEGAALILSGAIFSEGWLEIIDLKTLTFAEVGLTAESSDRDIWRRCQAREMILLTANRNMKGDDSLERTIREENTPVSLPVVTIGDRDRLREKGYRDRCVNRLLEIILDIDSLRGVGRLFIP